MKIYKLVYSEKAVSDLENIKTYISVDLKNSEAATRTCKRIIKDIESLKNYPERGGWLFSKLTHDYKFITSGNYLIAYRIDAEHVHIVRILYKHRDIRRKLI